MNSLFFSIFIYFFIITIVFFFIGSNLFIDINSNVYAEIFFGNAPNNKIDYPFQLQYPDGWKPEGHNIGITFFSNETSQSWSAGAIYHDWFDISYFKRGETTLKDLIKNDLTSLQVLKDNENKPFIKPAEQYQMKPKFDLQIVGAFKFLDPELNIPIYAFNVYSILENSDIVVFRYSSITRDLGKYGEFLEFVESFKSKKAFKDKVIRGFQVSNNPNGFAINTATNTFYIANSEDNSVSVVDGNGNQEIKILQVGKYPFEIAIDESANKIYVLNFNSSDISVINGRDNTLENTINVSGNPADIAINENLKQIYVAHAQLNNVTIINSLNGEKKRTFYCPANR